MVFRTRKELNNSQGLANFCDVLIYINAVLVCKTSLLVTKANNTRHLRPYGHSVNAYVYKNIRIKFLILRLGLLTGSTARRCLRVSARMSGRFGKHRLFSRFIDSNVFTVRFTIFLMCGLESCLTIKSGPSTVISYAIT